MRLFVHKPCSMVVSKVETKQYATIRLGPRSLKVMSSWKPSRTGECSVSNRETKLSNKWMEYQGIKNWDGLLDPLDEDLRSEILRYGGFVEAAYRSFEFDKSSPGKYGTCRYGRDSLLTQCGLGGIGYKVTKNLRATSGIQMPGWIDKTPSWVSTQSSWIGYVAVCTDKEEISRLGRRDVVIALRGTVTCLEWMENLRVTLTTLSCKNEMDQSSSSSRAMVEQGFLSLYTSKMTTCPSLRDSVREEISRIIQTYGDKEPLSFTITGHSLGAALATLTAYDISSTFKQLTTVISFGGPRVGNKKFSENLERNGTRILRIVNSNDVITKVPGFVIKEDQHNINTSDQKKKVKNGNQKLITTASLAARLVPAWLQKHVENTQWLYADVGKELQLCCNNSNMVTCHDLKTYLDLVNCFVSSTCPLRATAKKVLCRRAQHDQQQLLLR
ncbi:phospholipase A(1) DAD1, chloroplastic-like [Apium graveolens]|uniref:phospholipase A(1) DAD1, chloroplastic-like n=1 Tax=Apium graveolens TaxID=4045 RepID=UPI003D794007